MAANYLKLTASDIDDQAAAKNMIDALNSGFGSDAPFTNSTFDVRQMLATAATSEKDTDKSKAYNAAVALIDKLNENWKKSSQAQSAVSEPSTYTVNANGTVSTSSTTATYTF